MISNALQITGWMSSTELHWLAEQAKKAQVIIEVGSYFGRSTMALADNCPGVVYAVDPYLGEYHYEDGRVMMAFDDGIFKQFKLNLKNHLSSGKVIQERITFPEFNMKADFIFIDGDHRYESVKKDILHANKLLEPGKVLAGHDYTHRDWPGVKKAVDELIGKVDLCDSIWWKIV